jgi:CRP-like cAMP-binding protein
MARKEPIIGAEIEAVPTAFAIGVPSVERIGSDRHTLEMLSEVPLFQTLPKRHLHKLGRVAKPVRFSAGRMIVKEGSAGTTFFVIVDGRAKVFSESANRLLAHFGRGDFFGELALLDGRPRSASVVAETDVDAIQLSRKAFRDLLMHDPEVGLKIMEDLAGRIRDLTRTLSG